MRYFDRDDQVADGYYYDKTTGVYFYTPDGEGRYYYDSLAEMIEQHGDPDVLRRVYLDPEEV
jgi:cytochrome oxidase Cu insertion factor (SCO1/SenC/PrrC family)